MTAIRKTYWQGMSPRGRRGVGYTFPATPACFAAPLVTVIHLEIRCPNGLKKRTWKKQETGVNSEQAL